MTLTTSLESQVPSTSTAKCSMVTQLRVMAKTTPALTRPTMMAMGGLKTQSRKRETETSHGTREAAIPASRWVSAGRVRGALGHEDSDHDHRDDHDRDDDERDHEAPE